MKKVAFIVQRCGLEVNGGAEVHCFKIAKQMSRYWETEILTTCAVDYLTWKNHYAPGVGIVDGILIRRFKISKERNIDQFNKLSENIKTVVKCASIFKQEKWMKSQGPWSPDLMAFIKKYKDEYEAFIFFTYLYATTYFVLPLVKDKAFLAPLAHDEWPIYLSMWNKFFNMPVGFIFNTEEEKQFLECRFPVVKFNGPVAGVAVDPPESLNPVHFKKKFGLHEPFLLYIGRVDPMKGCEELFDYFISLKTYLREPLKLVLMGKPSMPVPNHPDIISLGFVDEKTKWNAIAACKMLVVSSLYESLSMVLLEAWTLGRPVLVNGGCRVLVSQCQRAQGGLWYTNYEEFCMAIEEIAARVGDQLGLQGKAFVQKNYSWPIIEKAYLNLIKTESGIT